MKERIRLFILVILSMALLLPYSLGVYATGDSTTNTKDNLNSSGFESNSVASSVVLDNANGIESVKTDINTKSQELGEFDWMTLNNGGDNVSVTLDDTGYASLTNKNKKKLMSYALTCVSKSQMDTRNKGNLYNFLEEQDEATAALTRELSEDVSSDFASAMIWFRPFNGPINTLLGILAIIIFAFTGLSTIVDIAYLVLPMFRMMCDKTDGSRPKYISYEAFNTVQQAEAEKRGNYLGLYLKNRTGMLFMLCICLGYLCSGQIYEFIGNIIDTASDVIKVMMDSSE